MAVSMERLVAIKKEWADRFAKLPADGGADVTQIPKEQQLVWGWLPKRAWEFEQPRAAAAALEKGHRAVSGALENPPVDPLTGAGRTSAMVERDVAAYRACVRAQLGSAVPPVFQADYLLLQPPSGVLGLHRVSNGIFLEDALNPHIHFSAAEYAPPPPSHPP